jgi:hypothetical protein
LCANFVADHFTEQKTAVQIRDIFAAAKVSAEKRCNTAMASFDANPLRTIAFYLPQYHPIPENDEWWGKGFTEWRNVCKAKPLFAGHYQPHIPADLGFYDLRLEEARVAQADLARRYGIDGFCYYHYWFNGKRLIERPVEEMLASGKPNFPFCLCWANENWTRRWDGEDSLILMEQRYSEADDRAHIQDLFRFFEDSRYIRVNGKPLFLVYRTENMPDPARTAEVWREEARKAGIGELYLVRVESVGRVNPHFIGFDAALEFAPDWNRMGPVVRTYAPGDTDLPETVELPSNVYENNHTRGYAELMEQMLEKEQPPFPWLRCVTPSWDNSARRSESAVILLGSSPAKYQQWLEEIIIKTIVFNRPSERLVFVNAWNEWAEGNHLEPCIKWGRSYLEATKSALRTGLGIYPCGVRLSHKMPKFSDEVIGEEGDRGLAASLVKLMAEKKSPEPLIISIEEFHDRGDLTYLKGWAAINDNVSTEGTDIMILVHKRGGKTRLIIPAKRKRPEITAHFENRCNYDYSGFEVRTKPIDPTANISVVIKRNGEFFWQAYRNAGESGIENGPATCLAASSLSHQIPILSEEAMGEEGDQELAASLVRLTAEKKSSRSLIISFEEFNDLGDLTYLKGWAAINDDLSTEGTDITILVDKPGDKARLIIPSKRRRPEITAHFGNRCNYDFSGFEAMTKRIDSKASVFVFIKRNGDVFWQAYR